MGWLYFTVIVFFRQALGLQDRLLRLFGKSI
jgi:hypothetical protein